MPKKIHKGKGVYIEYNFQIIFVATKPAQMFTLFPLVVKTQLAHSAEERLFVMEEELFEICLGFKKLNY